MNVPSFATIDCFIDVYQLKIVLGYGYGDSHITTIRIPPSPPPVAVRPSPHGGKGLFVTAAVKEGHPLLLDAPLAALPQGFSSRARALACSACGRHAGGPAAAAAHALLSSGAAQGEHVPALLRLVAGVDSLPDAPVLKRAAAPPTPSSPGGGGRGEWALPAPTPTVCPGGCTQELYCSRACAAADWATCHGAVCGGDGVTEPERAGAAGRLEAVARGGNSALWLAARAARKR
jgi:hypothetical protein